MQSRLGKATTWNIWSLFVPAEFTNLIAVVVARKLLFNDDIQFQLSANPKIMSSFKRKGSVKQTPGLPGTRVSPATPMTTIISTGIPSLDDILGGGLPLSCSMLIAAPDLHTSYGDLVLKYFTAQGLVSHHRLFIVDDNAEAFTRDIMWSPPGRSNITPDKDEDEKIGQQEDQKIKIAWRYGQMKPFQTTVHASSSTVSCDAVIFLIY